MSLKSELPDALMLRLRVLVEIRTGDNIEVTGILRERTR
jgi:hypothetical protein